MIKLDDLKKRAKLRKEIKYNIKKEHEEHQKYFTWIKTIFPDLNTEQIEVLKDIIYLKQYQERVCPYNKGAHIEIITFYDNSLIIFANGEHVKLDYESFIKCFKETIKESNLKIKLEEIE